MAHIYMLHFTLILQINNHIVNHLYYKLQFVHIIEITYYIIHFIGAQMRRFEILLMIEQGY